MNTRVVRESGGCSILLHPDHCRERMGSLVLVTDRDDLGFKAHWRFSLALIAIRNISQRQPYVSVTRLDQSVSDNIT